jgi:hypothetical protein
MIVNRRRDKHLYNICKSLCQNLTAFRAAVWISPQLYKSVQINCAPGPQRIHSKEDGPIRLFAVLSEACNWQIGASLYAVMLDPNGLSSGI